MKTTILYPSIFFILITAFTLGSCNKDLSLKKSKLTDSTATVSTLISGLYNYITADNAGNVYALHLNYGADTIYKIDASGNKSFFYTPPVTLDHDTTVVNTMMCLTADSTGNIYTVNYVGGYIANILKISSGGSASTIISNISQPYGLSIQKIAVNQGNFYFADHTGVNKITAGGATSLLLNGVSVFTVNRDGVIYYPVLNNASQVNLGQLSASGTKYTFTTFTLSSVLDLITDGNDNIYISEATADNKAVIQAVNAARTKIKTIISSTFGHVDGPIATAKISTAFSLATDNAGSLYFTELAISPNDIRKITF